MSESLPIHSSVEQADSRIQSSKENLSTERKEAIAKREKSILNKLEDYQRMGIYEGVLENYKDLQASDDHTPENQLFNIKSRFDRMRASEDAQAAISLNTVAVGTLNELAQIEQELQDSAAYEHHVAIEVQAEYERMLPNHDFSIASVSSSISAMGEAIGEQPNIQKLKDVEQENEFLLSELRQIDNHEIYRAAQTEFRALSGINMEDLQSTLASSLDALNQKTGQTKMEAIQQLTRTYKQALDSYELLNAITTDALFNPDFLSQQEASEETNTKAFDEQEMALILDVILNGLEHDQKGQLEQVFDANQAFAFYTDTNPEHYKYLPEGDQHVLAAAQGVGTGAAMLAGTIRHPIDTLEGIVTVAGDAMNPENRALAMKIAQYGWDNTSITEKRVFVTKLLAEFASGEVLTAGMGAAMTTIGKVAASSKLGNKLSTISRVSRYAKYASYPSKIALQLNPVLQKVPQLARYGSYAKDISKNLITHAKKVLKKIRYVSKQAVAAEGVAEYAARQVAWMGQGTKEELGIIQRNLQIALKHAKQLGISEQEIFTMQSLVKHSQKMSS